MCPLRFTRCPNHYIGFSWNVKIFDDNKRGYVISYVLCRNRQQVTVYYKFYGENALQTFLTPPNNEAAFATFRQLLRTPYARIYLISSPHNLRLIHKHKKEGISLTSYIFKIFTYKKPSTNMSFLCLTTICFALFTTLALIVRIHLICMYTVINLMTSLRLFCPQLWILLFYTSCYMTLPAKVKLSIALNIV